MKYHFISLFLLMSIYIKVQSQTLQANNISKPFVLGIVNEIASQELHENRIINIYFPEGYRQEDTVRYPVIYLLDGSANEDFIHIVGLVQFNSFEWINRIPKSIVVGIATVDRRRDFTFPTTIASDLKKYPSTGHSQSFIAFIEKELLPFIDANYKTSATKTIIGQSLGGLLAAEILLTKPNLFSKYCIVSPSIWWNNGSLLKAKNVNLAQVKSPIQVYIGVGKEGLTPTAIPRIMQDDARDLAKKIEASNQKMLQVHFDFLPKENHATILHQAVSNAIPLIFP
ncbi:MAG: hypothetical protein RLZ56_1156 [Bacteroidota bacterium]